MKNLFLSFTLLLLLCSCSTTKVIDHNIADNSINKVSFTVIGDMPYSDKERLMMSQPNGSIYKTIRRKNPAVLIHFGDLKSSAESCTDELLLSRRELLFNLNPHKVVYTPGDNGWTDCDRNTVEVKFDELERLHFIREHFYRGEGEKLTRDLKGIIRQENFIENAMWTIEQLKFATLHVPGTNNGREHIYESDIEDALDEADRRDNYNELWLDKLFNEANSASGVVIIFQADIYHVKLTTPDLECTFNVRIDCDGFKRIREQIKHKARLYKKPVLVIHGDTNAYCLHQQALIEAENLWRLNGPGDYELSDGAQVVFDANNTNTPFTVQTLLKGDSFPVTCDYSR
jgi:hypothetical protein